jgi:hypothetical protein
MASPRLVFSQGFNGLMLAGIVRTFAIVQRRMIMAGDTPVEVGRASVAAAGATDKEGVISLSGSRV